MEVTPKIVESLARDIYNKALWIIQEETGVTLERICELAKADSEGRCVIFSAGYGVVKDYSPPDECGICFMTASGVVSSEEYKAALPEKEATP